MKTQFKISSIALITMFAAATSPAGAVELDSVKQEIEKIYQETETIKNCIMLNECGGIDLPDVHEQSRQKYVYGMVDIVPLAIRYEEEKGIAIDNTLQEKLDVALNDLYTISTKRLKDIKEIYKVSEPEPTPESEIEVESTFPSFYLNENLINSKRNCATTLNMINTCYSWSKTYKSKISGQLHSANMNIDFTITDDMDLAIEAGYKNFASSIGSSNFIYLSTAVDHTISGNHVLNYNLAINGSPSGILPFVGAMSGVSYAYNDFNLLDALYPEVFVDFSSSFNLGFAVDKENVSLLWMVKGGIIFRGSYIYLNVIELSPAFDMTLGMSGYRAFRKSKDVTDYVFASPVLTTTLRFDINFVDLLVGRIFVSNKFMIDGSSISVGASFKFSIE